MCAKRALASSAALAASRGRMNTLGTDSMAAMERISLEHLHHSTAPGGAPLSPAVHIVQPRILLETRLLLARWYTAWGRMHQRPPARSELMRIEI